MKLGDYWKKSITNKWLVFEKDKKIKHFFYLTKLHPKLSWNGRPVTHGGLFNGYHAKELEGSIVTFEFAEDIPADLASWGKCSYLNNSRAFRKLEKRMTKSLLKDEHSESRIGTNVFKEVFGVEHDGYRF